MMIKYGFSLVECMVYIAGVALVSSLAFHALYDLRSSQQSLYDKIASRVALSNAVLTMRRDIARQSVSQKHAVSWSVENGYLVRKNNIIDHNNIQKITSSVVLGNVRSCNVLFPDLTMNNRSKFATIIIERANKDQLSTFALIRNRTVTV